MRTFFRKLFSPIIWGNLLAMVVVAVGIFCGVKVWLDRYTHHGEQIKVPAVVGRIPMDARALLETQGLRATISDSSYDANLPAGVILSQNPLAGSIVKEGREIDLMVNSREAPRVAIPDIAGNCSMREAEERLLGLGFEVAPVQYVEGDAGWVYGMRLGATEVRGGEMVPRGSRIVLLVGGKSDSDSLVGEDIYDYE